MSRTWVERKAIADDTLSRVDAVIESCPSGSLDSTFIADQLPALDKDRSPNHPPTLIKVINSDSFTAARDIVKQFPEAKSKTAVLNLASDEIRAGGWIETLSRTQEEALCYSSTLYPTLKAEYYPWPNLGKGCVAGIYSPSVVVFKDDLDHDCVDLPQEEWQLFSVITVAAPRDPSINKAKDAFLFSRDLNYMREKIRLVYRMAASNGQEYMVLAAMGCGAYRCPAKQVAEEMKAILLEDEFKGWFREVVFAVYSVPGNPNNEIFKEVLDGVELNGESPPQERSSS